MIGSVPLLPSAVQTLGWSASSGHRPAPFNDDHPVGLDRFEDHFREGREARRHRQVRREPEPLPFHRGPRYLVPAVGTVSWVEPAVLGVVVPVALITNDFDPDGMVNRSRRDVRLGDLGGEVADTRARLAVGAGNTPSEVAMLSLPPQHADHEPPLSVACQNSQSRPLDGW